jgi:hypothetical protein
MAFPFIGKEEAQDFRLQLYNSFEKRNDLTFELIDALSSQSNPDCTVFRCSQNPTVAGFF